MLQTLGHGELLLEARKAAGKTQHSRGSSAQAPPARVCTWSQPPVTLHPAPGTAQHHTTAAKLIWGKWEQHQHKSLPTESFMDLQTPSKSGAQQVRGQNHSLHSHTGREEAQQLREAILCWKETLNLRPIFLSTRM